jgi:RNA polymerase sigma-70 factor (ECF subfamily)
VAKAQTDTVIRHLRRAVLRKDGAGWTDGQLLASFIAGKDEAAFEALVRHHGPMVFSVCRRLLRNHHDAEDAFQATFLVLARRASSVRPRERVASWLHGVALRTAMKARAMTAKRRGREQQVTEMPEPEAAQQGRWLDVQPLLDQELNGLPESYRLPILLCDLEGKTIKEAARQLGWPQGTVAGRLARGRKLLAKRLASRGVALSAGSLVAVVTKNEAAAGVPSSLVSSTVKATSVMAAGQATVTRMVPGKVALLMEGVMRSMMLTKVMKSAVAGLLMLCLCGLGVGGGGLLMTRTMAQQPEVSNKVESGAKRAPAKTDLDRLQGVWSICWYERGGKRHKADNIVFMVDGKRACWQDKDSETQGGLYLNPTAKPKTYDLATSTATLEGIYSLDGDTLELCFEWTGTESKRPVSFITERGSRQVHLGFKRIQGPEVFPGELPDGTKVRAFPAIVERETPSDPLRAGVADQRETPPPLPRPTAPRPKADTQNTDKKAARVGSIFLVGNTKTEQSVILEKIPLAPGDVIDYHALRKAEKDLASFHASITVLESDSESDFKDILVRVKEK